MNHIWGIFDLIVRKVIGCTCLKMAVTREQLAEERKALKFETQGLLVEHILGNFEFVVSR